jgi:hypothetical protein
MADRAGRQPRHHQHLLRARTVVGTRIIVVGQMPALDDRERRAAFRVPPFDRGGGRAERTEKRLCSRFLLGCGARASDRDHLAQIAFGVVDDQIAHARADVNEAVFARLRFRRLDHPAILRRRRGVGADNFGRLRVYRLRAHADCDSEDERHAQVVQCAHEGSPMARLIV